jgi:hypothetical protein
MTRPFAKFPRRIKLDVMILAVGAVVMMATALWLEPTRDGFAQRAAQSAQSTGQLLWNYVTERKKPAVPKLKAPL